MAFFFDNGTSLREKNDLLAIDVGIQITQGMGRDLSCNMCQCLIHTVFRIRRPRQLLVGLDADVAF